MRNQLLKFIAAGFAASLLLGCHREESKIQVYRVAKDNDSSAAMGSLPSGHPAVSGANAPALTYTKPEGWTEETPGDMRVASFKVNENGKTADVSVIPLPGMAGSDEANVNRWRGQVSLSPISADELQKSAQSLEIDGQPAQLYDIDGKNPANGESARILGVIQHHEGNEWFFKMTGDSDLVEAQKPAFVEFLKSVKFTGATAAPGMGEMPSSLPAGHPAIGDMNSAMESSAPISHEGQPDWQVPSDWKEVSGGQFLIAKFLINNDAAAVNVSSSAGDGGGLEANVNRWRGQLGLQPAAVSATPVDVTSGKGELVELSGTNVQNGQPAQLVAVMVLQPDRAWFYKLMGDPKTVEAQKAAFLKFVQSAKY